MSSGSLPAPGLLAVSNCPPVYSSVAELNAGSHYGSHGGRYIPETLLAAHEELESVYVAASADPAFREQLELLGRDFIGRDTPLYFASRLTARAGEGAPGGAAQIWLKREELAHTGSHKINNAIGQVRGHACAGGGGGGGGGGALPRRPGSTAAEPSALAFAALRRRRRRSLAPPPPRRSSPSASASAA